MLVTIFGDLAQAEGETISGPTLTRLTEGLGIKPEAVRVALHRLRNEGWISSAKSGRTALHGLTPHGRRESQSASRLIYARAGDLPQTWQMLLTESNDAGQKTRLTTAGFVPIMPRVYVGHDGLHVPPDCIATRGIESAPWLGAQIVSPQITTQSAELLTVLRATSDALRQNGAMSPLDTALSRCLIVHHWRRLILRAPYLPPAITGADWPGHLCRAEVSHLLARLPRPPLTAL